MIGSWFYNGIALCMYNIMTIRMRVWSYWFCMQCSHTSGGARDLHVCTLEYIELNRGILWRPNGWRYQLRKKKICQRRAQVKKYHSLSKTNELENRARAVFCFFTWLLICFVQNHDLKVAKARPWVLPICLSLCQFMYVCDVMNETGICDRSVLLSHENGIRRKLAAVFRRKAFCLPWSGSIAIETL